MLITGEHTSKQLLIAFGTEPYTRGYTPLRIEAVRAAIRNAHQTKLWRSLTAALSDHTTILAVIAITRRALKSLHPLIGMLCYLVGLVVIARCLRGIECLGHEASHWNWTREYKKLNDGLANALVAFPVFARVSSYRAGHLEHHGRFGTERDPDRKRYRELNLEQLDRSGLPAFSAGLLRRLPRYILGWWTVIGTDLRALFVGLIWHASACTLLSLAFDPGDVLFVWTTWMVCFLLVLPVIRLIGESGEHIYTGNNTIFEATVTNVGLIHRLLTHPHGDGWHLVHHLWMGVPHHQLRSLHRALCELDPAGFGGRVKVRTGILQDAQPTRQAGRIDSRPRR